MHDTATSEERFFARGWPSQGALEGGGKRGGWTIRWRLEEGYLNDRESSALLCDFISWFR